LYIVEKSDNFPTGTAFNWGVWVGYAAVHGAVDYATCGSLYAAGICWTLIYDTIYAHQVIFNHLGIHLTSPSRIKKMIR